MKVDIKDFDRAMRRKNFKILKIKKKNPHLFFYFEYPEGNLHISINTWRSVHPRITHLDDNRIKDMASELHFKRKREFEDYIDCRFTIEMYVDLLKEEKLI